LLKLQGNTSSSVNEKKNCWTLKRKRLRMTKTVGHYSMKTLGKNELLGSVVKLLTQQRAVPLSGIGRLHEPPYDGGSHAEGALIPGVHDELHPVAICTGAQET
jgi:hypothetical protein